MLPLGLTAADLITLILFATIQTIAFGVFMSRFNAKFAVHFEKVNDHSKVLFAGNGTLNILTIEAADRMKLHCSGKHAAEEVHIKNDLIRIERNLQADIDKLDARSIETKSCVAVLQHQIEGGC